MEYFYYESPKGNFGDDINIWLWPKIFNDINDTFSSTYFLGIGSILYNENDLIKEIWDKNKIVFGTGVRATKSLEEFHFDQTWDIRFLRGPLSSSAFNYTKKFITDGAYAFRSLEGFDNYLNFEKKYEVSLMPYFKSVDKFNWEKICNNLGYNYISPYSEKGVEHTLIEIASSKKIITEAMHGAIFADILRVPWHRFILSTSTFEGELTSEFKWMDWLMSVDMGATKNTYIPYYRKTVLHNFIKKISSDILSVEFFIHQKTNNDLIKKLSSVNEYYLSKDSKIKQLDILIKDEIYKLKDSFH